MAEHALRTYSKFAHGDVDEIVPPLVTIGPVLFKLGPEML